MHFSKIPYFMTNEEWYERVDVFSETVPDDDRGYVLTDKAPQEAIDSYNAFYELLDDERPDDGLSRAVFGIK